MGSETKQQTAKSTSEPWIKQAPYIEYGMQQAKDIYQNQTPSYFPQSTVSGFSPEQQQAHQLGAQRALGGNANMKAASGFNMDVLGGKYLNSDPYQDSVFQNIQQKVMPSVNSMFSGAGRYGSDLHADTAARGMTEAYAPYASAQYQSGLDRMGNAANQAQMFAQNDYTDLAALEGIGAQKQGMAQNELGDAVNRWNFYQDLPANQLGQYMGFTGGNYGGTTTSSTPYQQPSIWSQVAGAALTAAPYVLSDARAKQNIRRVGVLDNGLPVYAYQYKGSDVSHIGVLAQEAEQVMPASVYTDALGIKYVNYDTLTRV